MMSLSLQELEAMRGGGRVPYLTVEKWRELDVADQSKCGLYKGLDDCEAKASDSDGKSLVTMVASTGQVDRDGDTLSPAGWDLGAFKKHGPILWAHDQRALPIGVATKVQKNVDGKLIIDAEFTSEEMNPLGNNIFRMIKAKILKAISVGFLPKKHKVPDESEGRGPFGVDFTLQELLEGSVVNVASNTGAFATAKSLGISMYPMVEWCETHLDFVKGSGLWMTRDQLEKIWLESRDEKKTFDFARIIGSSGTGSGDEPGTQPDDANSDNEDKSALSDADVARIVDGVTASLKESAGNNGVPSESANDDKTPTAEGDEPEPGEVDFLGLLKAYNADSGNADNGKENEQ